MKHMTMLPGALLLLLQLIIVYWKRTSNHSINQSIHPLKLCTKVRADEGRNLIYIVGFIHIEQNFINLKPRAP